eukprot:1559061-Prymnesium_polylepis.2
MLVHLDPLVEPLHRPFDAAHRTHQNTPLPAQHLGRWPQVVHLGRVWIILVAPSQEEPKPFERRDGTELDIFGDAFARQKLHGRGFFPQAFGRHIKRDRSDEHVRGSPQQ